MEKRKDRKRASRAGAQHGLALFALAQADHKDLLRFFNDYPKPPANKIRVKVVKFGLGSANTAEILSSLASISAFYQVPEVEIQRRAVSVGSRMDKLAPAERLSMVRTLLTWFENNQPVRQALRWRHARDQSMYALMHCCGLTLGTLIEAKKKDLDLFGGTLTYKSAGELKTCRFPQEVVTPLWRYGSSNPPHRSDYLFVNHHGRRLSRSGANDTFNERLREARLSQDLQLRSIRLSFHSLNSERVTDESLKHPTSKGRKETRPALGKPSR
jgi:integrase